MLRPVVRLLGGARRLSTDGKKLPREMVAAMTSEGEDVAGYRESMRSAMAAKEGRLRPMTPEKSYMSDAQKVIYERILEDRGKTGAKAGFSATNEDGSLAGPWNATRRVDTGGFDASHTCE